MHIYVHTHTHTYTHTHTHLHTHTHRRVRWSDKSTHTHTHTHTGGCDGLVKVWNLSETGDAICDSAFEEVYKVQCQKRPNIVSKET